MIDLKNISVRFETDDNIVNAVNDVSLHVDEGDIYGIVGYSGAGKSTLVRTINLLQRPSEGQVIVNDMDMMGLSNKELRQTRKSIGMIFQHFNLMSSRTVAGNVLYALRDSDLSKEERNARVVELLELVGLADRQSAYPSQLSGGQKQRVGIARALANDPKILLCDEATSALDPKTTQQILELLKELNKKLNLTIVIITHEMEAIKEICNKVAVMENGQVLEQGDIVDIFTQPEDPLTKEFINTATHIDQAYDKLSNTDAIADIKPDDMIAQFSFTGGSAGEPLVTELLKRFDISTNILYGNVEILNGTTVGNLIVILDGNSGNLEDAYQFLRDSGVKLTLLESIKTEDGTAKLVERNVTVEGGL